MVIKCAHFVHIQPRRPRVRSAMDVIPFMSHELGRFWKQPSRRNILIGENDAYMSAETRDRLSDYSSTNPSGVYEGKTWRRIERANDGLKLEYLCWYVNAEVYGREFCRMMFLPIVMMKDKQ